MCYNYFSCVIFDIIISYNEMARTRSVSSTHVGTSREVKIQRPTTSVCRRNHGEPLDVNLVVATQMVGDSE